MAGAVSILLPLGRILKVEAGAPKHLYLFHSIHGRGASLTDNLLSGEEGSLHSTSRWRHGELGRWGGVSQSPPGSQGVHPLLGPGAL